MKKIASATALAALLALAAVPRARAADGSTFVDTGTPGDGLIGQHVWGTAVNNRGFGLDYASTSSPGWSLGLEQGYGDLYLFNYNYVNSGSTVASNQTWFRMRGDTGQLTLGSGVGHAPDGWQQVAIGAGTSTAPLDGLGIAAFGTHNQLNLYQGNAGSNHTQLNLASKWLICTDQGNNGGLDMYFYDNTLAHQVVQITNTDLVKLNYGATVNGTLTANGPSSLLGSTTVGASGSTLGFYGAAGMTRQVITGCRSDGTALASLITALKNLGLVDDQTTP